MELYLVVSEIELENTTLHYIHYISQSLKNATKAYESIDRKEKDGILLIKMKSDNLLDYEFFGISNYDNNIEIIKAYPNYNLR